MARIPDDVLARLKAEVSVQRLVEGVGVVLRRQGNDLVGACPFHDDGSPSLVVSSGKNLWHCLGACQTGGGPVVAWTSGEAWFDAVLDALATPEAVWW